MLLESKSSALVVIDIQARLMPAIPTADRVVKQTRILLEAARRLEVPVIATQQYPKGLGLLVDEIAETLPNDATVCDKVTFSAARDDGFLDVLSGLEAAGRRQAVICGSETHVCVLQTAVDLKERGDQVFVVTDACGSRTEENWRAAIERMAGLGIACVTTEMVLFEWVERAGTDDFRSLHKLVR